MLIIWEHKVITIINKYMMMDYHCIILRIRVIDPCEGKLHRSLDGDWLFLSLVCIVSQWDGSLLNRLNNNLTAFFSLLSGVQIISEDISAGRKPKLKLPPPLNPPVGSESQVPCVRRGGVIILTSASGHQTSVILFSMNWKSYLLNHWSDCAGMLCLCVDVTAAKWCNCCPVA